MNDNAVIFKGTKEGLFMILKEELDFESIKNNLEKKIKPSKRFFEGANIVNVKGKHLTQPEFEELKQIMQQDYGMMILGTYRECIADVSLEKEESKEENIPVKLHYDSVGEGASLIVRGTIRSGQLIEYKGSIVVIGDINPGAEIKATGSIVVMGGLRGVAHAGTNGDYNSFIAAINLQPTQLRIGDIITRAPDGIASAGSKTGNGLGHKSRSRQVSSIPEMANVRQGMIVVEPYLPNK